MSRSVSDVMTGERSALTGRHVPAGIAGRDAHGFTDVTGPAQLGRERV